MVFILHKFFKTTLIMKKILIPCDFSDASESALNYGVELAKYLSASLVLLHADQIPVMSPEMSLSTYPLQDTMQESLDALKNLADKIKITSTFNAPIDYFAETGNTTDIILEHVKKVQADLVVMGINGHGSKFMKALVGSVSVDISRKMEVPLLIVPPDVAYKKIQNIAYACSLDESLENSATLIRIKYLATLFAATLNVVHIVPQGHVLSPAETSVGNFVERSLENAPHKTFMITEKNASEGLLHFIDTHRVDMIVLEPRKHSLFHNLFMGSTTKELAFNSPVPVLTIHGPDNRSV